MRKFNNLITKAISFLKNFWFHVCIMSLIVLGSAFLVYVAQKPEHLPTFWISCIALSLSYYAHTSAKEKLRLDLLEKRFEIYEKVLEFCGLVTKHGTLTARPDNREEIEQALNAAYQSFLGIGLHKTRSLFGEDIYSFFSDLREKYIYLITHPYPTIPLPDQQQAEWAQKNMESINFILLSAEKMPDLFKPYVYFGNYRKNI
jgi:hypothetical protein